MIQGFFIMISTELDLYLSSVILGHGGNELGKGGLWNIIEKISLV